MTSMPICTWRGATYDALRGSTDLPCRVAIQVATSFGSTAASTLAALPLRTGTAMRQRAPSWRFEAPALPASETALAKGGNRNEMASSERCANTTGTPSTDCTTLSGRVVRRSANTLHALLSNHPSPTSSVAEEPLGSTFTRSHRTAMMR